MYKIAANQFWRKFQGAVKEISPEGYGGDWTKGMYEVLHRIKKEFNDEGVEVWCQCKLGHSDESGGKGERLAIDLMWYPNDDNADEWAQPLVAIEHENAWKERETLFDFWKVCQVIAPLRICIGYIRLAEKVRNLALDLIKVSRRSGWRRPPGGEDLLIMGHGEMDWKDFRAWLIDDNGYKELEKL